MPEVHIASVMQTEFITLEPDEPIRAAAARLVAANALAAPVVDNAGNLVGILTQRDCFRPALNASYYQQWQGTVAEVMSAGVATLDASIDIVEAAEQFLSRPYRSYPVMDGGTLVGLLDRHELLAAFLERS